VSAAPDAVKACCAEAYAGVAARFLLGETFHPGGEALTRELLAALALRPGSLVLDVGSGPGTSALIAAGEGGLRVVGADLSPESVHAASRRAAESGLAGRVRFVVADAEALPLPEASFDGALCECALCTFPDKVRAAGELARVLRPGARLALSDVTARPERLAPALTSLLARIACLADARPLEETAALLEASGFAVERTARHDAALGQLIDRVEARLRLVRLAGPELERELGEVSAGLELLCAARAALVQGTLGYASLVATRRAGVAGGG